MVEFGGWDMPVEYSGITDEHLAVRTRAGLFDVSHMGQIEVAGARAHRQVLVGDAGVLDRHVPAAERHHPRTERDVAGVQGCSLESGGIGL